LKSACRAGDVIGRIGGEEFCVLLPNTDQPSALALAQQLIAAVAARPFLVDQIEIPVTSSGGVSELRPCHASVYSLIDSADAALLVAKQTGRNKILTASSLEDAELSEKHWGPLRHLQARDIMVPAVAHVGLDRTVSETARVLMELNLDSVPVVDSAGKLIGFVTEQDVMTTLLESGGSNQSIASCGRHFVTAFEEDVPAEEIAAFFSRTSAKRVVIVRDGHPVGLLSHRTLLRWMFNYTLNDNPESTETCVDHGEFQTGDLERSITDLVAGVSRLVQLRQTGSGEEISSSVVGEATRIQESIENILIRCRDRAPRRIADLWTAGASSIG
jgi:CBS domain-containing protein